MYRSVSDIISRNLEKTRRRMAFAAEKSGRAAEAVRLVAVTKYAEDEAVSALLDLGVRDLGESRQQTLTRRAELWSEADFPDIRWHFIGPLQKNKMRRVLQAAYLIHSGESLEMLSALNRAAAEETLTARVLLEVNISAEENKHGFRPEELPGVLPEILTLSHLEIHGLMGMTTLDADKKTAHAQFASLRELRETLRAEITRFSPEKAGIFRELSMGMSDDYEIAITEGATMIRVGSAIFEE